MPPRKRAISKTTEDKAPFYHVVVEDGEKNTIRFGPFTRAEVLDPDDEDTPEAVAEALVVDIENHGLENALTYPGLWGGLTVRLIGDDGTHIKMCEIPITNQKSK